MPTDTTYTALRENLAAMLDKVVDEQTVVIVRRKKAGDVALLPAAELAGLIETAHLLRSPKNAKRLLAAVNRTEKRTPKPSTVKALRDAVFAGDGQ